MDTKNFDAIKKMAVRLQSIKDTDFLVHTVFLKLSLAQDILEDVVKQYENSPTKNAKEVRTEWTGVSGIVGRTG